MKLMTLILGATLAGGLAGLRAADTPNLEKARVYYVKECAKCHGEDGRGNTAQGKKLGAKDYTKADVQEKMKDAEAAKNIKEGMKKGRQTLMKAYDDLTDQEIKDLIALMRRFKKD